MSNIRLIARLDIKGINLIKGVHLEGLRVIGSPTKYAIEYYLQGIDELIFMDSVASLYGRNHLSDLISEVSRDVFVPITVGGGLRSVDDVARVLRSGADKVAINTAVVLNPNLITDVATRFGSQCMVLSIEAKELATGGWEVYTENGRQHSGLDVVSWARQAVEMGAGEILLTSIDREGTRKGFDIRLTQTITSAVTVPVIASGGMGSASDLVSVVKEGQVNAVAMADILHYGRDNVSSIRNIAKISGLSVRDYAIR